MADATFDGDNLLIELPATQTEIDVERELYSAWKEWLKTSDNAKYALAFRSVAGDEIEAPKEVASYFFLRNDLGWRIRAADENIEINFTGNLYKQDSTQDMITLRAGRTAGFYFDRSANALVVNQDKILKTVRAVLGMVV